AAISVYQWWLWRRSGTSVAGLRPGRSGRGPAARPAYQLLQPQLVERLGQGLGPRQAPEQTRARRLVDQDQDLHVSVRRALAKLPHQLPGRAGEVVVDDHGTGVMGVYGRLGVLVGEDGLHAETGPLQSQADQSQQRRVR